MNDLMKQLKFAIAIILSIVLAAFAIQNMAEVELSFLTWTFQSRRIVVIGVSFVCGALIGWLFGRFKY